MKPGDINARLHPSGWSLKAPYARPALGKCGTYHTWWIEVKTPNHTPLEELCNILALGGLTTYYSDAVHEYILRVPLTTPPTDLTK
jgi:hypothetical protein